MSAAAVMKLACLPFPPFPLHGTIDSTLVPRWRGFLRFDLCLSTHCRWLGSELCAKLSSPRPPFPPFPTPFYKTIFLGFGFEEAQKERIPARGPSPGGGISPLFQLSFVRSFLVDIECVLITYRKVFYPETSSECGQMQCEGSLSLSRGVGRTSGTRIRKYVLVAITTMKRK